MDAEPFPLPPEQRAVKYLADRMESLRDRVGVTVEELAHYIAGAITVAVAEERERCANLMDEMETELDGKALYYPEITFRELAARIRTGK